MNKIVTVILFICLVIGALQTQVWAQEELSFKVIVNKANPTSSLSKTELSRFFMKKVVRWESGDAVQPVDLTSNSPVRKI